MILKQPNDRVNPAREKREAVVQLSERNGAAHCSVLCTPKAGLVGRVDITGRSFGHGQLTSLEWRSVS